ncbi:MAG TPA: apolipoprotein N-acyltransferase [Planctomycetota bacterium]|nr:apolipoprotein N-acyltransferase [Planctomycetota bacterium]
MHTLPGPRILWVLGAGVFSAVLLRLAYPVPGLWPLAWVALVPWFAALREGSGRQALLGSLVMGLLAAGMGLSWQSLVTVPGWAGLTLYVGSYFVLFAWLVRAATRRLRVPFVVAAPVVWVGCEHLRSFLITGFPWLFLGHTQFPFTALVQVSDLFGAYAVSFVLAAANAFVADAALAWWRGEAAWRRLARGAAFAGVLTGGALGYGAWRLATLEIHEGPLVGIVQGNVPQDVKNKLTLEAIAQIFREHEALTLRLPARAGGRPLDLVVWPETMVQLPLNHGEYPVVREYRERIGRLALLLGCPMLIGAHAEIGLDFVIEADADGTVRAVADGEITTESHAYPLPHYRDPETGTECTRRILVREGQRVSKGDALAEYESLVHNSSYLFRPGSLPTRADRYDKTHLVPFGEYMPLGGTLWFLRQVVPYGKGFSHGERLDPLRIGDTRFGVLICFESAFPGISRAYVAPPDGAGADFLINTSNDGWFKGSHELDQHLAICGFRAIENRIGIVRSVNSGISGIIDPAGRIREVVHDDRGRTKLVAGVAVGRVPVRRGLTFYARHGDLFAGACLLFTAGVFLAALGARLFARLRRRRAAPSPS